jgi:hypothetical protein
LVSPQWHRGNPRFGRAPLSIAAIASSIIASISSTVVRENSASSDDADSSRQRCSTPSSVVSLGVCSAMPGILTGWPVGGKANRRTPEAMAVRLDGRDLLSNRRAGLRRTVCQRRARWSRLPIRAALVLTLTLNSAPTSRVADPGGAPEPGRPSSVRRS